MNPTFSRDHRLEMHLNNGMFNGKPLYIHYTSAQTFPQIINSRCFMARPNYDRRGVAAKPGIYLVRSIHAFNAEKAFQQLFLGEAKYRESAKFCFLFTFNSDPHLTGHPVSAGSSVEELIHPGNISFSKINIIYQGINPFL